MPIILDTAAQFDFGSSEFHRLFRASRASAFQHPDWLAAFYRHVAPAHDAEPLVVTGRSLDGDLQLVVPLVRRKIGEEPATIEYAFLDVTDYACPIIADGFSLGVGTASRFRDVLGAHAGLRIGPVHHDHLHQWQPLLGIKPLTLDFGAHSVGYGFPYGEWRRSNLGKRQAAKLDSRARKLAEASGFRLDVLEPDDVPAAMIAARDFRAGRFPGDPLQTAHGLAFYTEVASQGARSGLARTFRLASKGGSAAYVFGLIDGDRFCYILLACDYAAYARYSPGRLVLDSVMAAWAADCGKTFDFTIGDEPFKTDFGCTRSTMHEFRW
jgi:CelD/BcsL family acetyltransferase involved in cellulose biosynthesis